MPVIQIVIGGGKRFLREMYNSFVRAISIPFTHILYGDIWTLRTKLRGKHNRFLYKIYNSYFEHYGSWVGLGAEIIGQPIFPHGLFGVFISNSAKVGKDVVIFHQVTIGSNTIKGSKKQGAPTIGNNVYIGCGAKLIGNINVGDNARIGANCVVVKDVPSNSVTIIRGVESIQKDNLDNAFVSNSYLTSKQFE